MALDRIAAFAVALAAVVVIATIGTSAGRLAKADRGRQPVAAAVTEEPECFVAYGDDTCS